MAATAPRPSVRPARRLGAGGWLGLILAATLGAYFNSFAVPFLFDDGPAILANDTLRQLWPPDALLTLDTRDGVTTAGRPVLVLSLAFNYAVSGTAVWSYHAVNLAIHLANGLLLFGLVRRTLKAAAPTPLRSAGVGAIPSPATPTTIALLVSALWLLHPLQTAAVTYIVQRAESLAAFFYLASVYAFTRGANSSTPRRWFAASVVACYLGMGTKEIVASAPLIIFAYDVIFVAGSIAAAWRLRRGVHLALVSSWLALLGLLIASDSRGSTAGFDSGVSSFNYALTQAEGLVRYLGLVVWPAGLTFDYGTATVASIGEVALPVALMLALIAATVVALRRWPRLGFLGLVFFAILAPSSSIVPIASQTLAEHRMYLPLAVPLVLVALVAVRRFGRVGLIALIVVAALWGVRTAARNHDYRSALAIWSDTAAKRPGNARAHHNLGLARLDAGDPVGASEAFQQALAVAPNADTSYNLGLALARQRRWDEAAMQYETALAAQPDHKEAWNNLGNVQLARGHPALARQAYERATQLEPRWAEAHSNLSNALLEAGDVPGAIASGEHAVALDARSAVAHFNLGNAYVHARLLDDARRSFARATELDPNYTNAWFNLGNVSIELDRLPEAADALGENVRLQPDAIPARRTLVALLAHLGRYDDAITHCQKLLEFHPRDAIALAQLEELQRAARRARSAR